MARSLPPTPSVEHLRKQAKALLDSLQARDPDAVARVRDSHPSAAAVFTRTPRLADAQLVVAREYGFSSWPKLKAHVDSRSKGAVPLVDDFLAACRDDVQRAERLLAENPRLAAADIYTSAVCGEAESVSAFLRSDPALANAQGGPDDWPPLLYVCFSRLGTRTSQWRRQAVVRCASLLLDAGADPNAGWIDDRWPDSLLTALYGACGQLNFPELAELLLTRGANPNDGESLYHSTEYADKRCMELLLAHGATPKAHVNILKHMLDREDIDGARILLEHGADPNVLPHAVLRGRSIPILQLLLDHGADIDHRSDLGHTAYANACRHGYPELADFLAAAGADTDALSPVECLLSVVSRDDAAAARRMIAANPDLIAKMSADDHRGFVYLANRGKTRLVKELLALGVPPDVRGDSNATALHWAASMGHRETVQALIAGGAEIDPVGTHYGTTPLGWAFHGACEQWNPDGDYAGIVRDLLGAGASLDKLKGQQPPPDLAAVIDDCKAGR